MRKKITKRVVDGMESNGQAAGIGAIFVVGRVVYFFGYRAAAEKRAVDALMSGPASYVLLIGAIIGLVRTLV